MTAAGQHEDKNMDEDKELLLMPAHMRAQARRDGEGSAPSSAGGYSSLARCVFPSKTPIQPKSEIACMLRAGERRHRTTDSLQAIHYGPVEPLLRRLLARLNWRRRPRGWTTSEGRQPMDNTINVGP